jgi:hypothetical protein
MTINPTAMENNMVTVLETVTRGQRSVIIANPGAPGEVGKPSFSRRVCSP